MISMNKIRALISGLFLTALLATTVLNAPSASAYTRRTVCADDLYVRDNNSIVIGTLHWGHTFDVYGPGKFSGQLYGFAWGGVNKWGNVYGYLLC